MSKPVRDFILKYIERNTPLPTGCEVDSFDYIQSGYVDSMGVVKFLVLLEAEFDIEITDQELMSSEFRTVGGVVDLIVMKMSNM